MQSDADGMGENGDFGEEIGSGEGLFELKLLVRFCGHGIGRMMKSWRERVVRKGGKRCKSDRNHCGWYRVGLVQKLHRVKEVEEFP